MQVAYVMVSLEHPDILKASIRSIKDEITRAPEVERRLLVVNNGSKDGTVRWVLGRERVLPIYLGANLGVPAALNIGFNYVIDNWDPEFIIRCDNDITVLPGATDEMVRVAREHDAIVGPYSNRGLLCQNARPADEAGYPLNPNEFESGSAIEVSTVAGFFCCYPTHIYKETNFKYGEYESHGFPVMTMRGDRVMRYAEDSIHHWMAALYGYKTMIAQAAWVIHIHSASADIGDVLRDRKLATEFHDDFNAAKQDIIDQAARRQSL